MGAITQWMDRTFYPRHTDGWDNWAFREAILARITPAMTVLDLGAGAGIVAAMNFKGKAAHVCGIDLDPRVTENPFLDEARIVDAGAIPYPDRSFDFVFCNSVVEHLEDPVAVFREVARVLRPGGHFMFKTPNRTHYMPMIAQLTPHSFHQAYNKARGREREDTFPTFYRANTRRDVEAVAKASGFSSATVARLEGRPEYLRMTALTYVPGILYERAVNASSRLEPLRVVLIADLEHA